MVGWEEENSFERLCIFKDEKEIHPEIFDRLDKVWEYLGDFTKSKILKAYAIRSDVLR